VTSYHIQYQDARVILLLTMAFSKELEHVLDQFLKYHTQILFRDFNTKVEREDIFTPTIGK